VKRGTSLVIVAVLSVLTAVLLLVFVLRLSAQPGAKVKLGSDVFPAGRARDLAARIRADRAPLLFPALVKERDIYLQHRGGDPLQGWAAFDARPPGSPRRCNLVWQRDRELFTDPCGGGTFPADGAGLPAHTVVIDAKGKLAVDLRPPA
jgi:hypothetical protein